MTQLDNCQGDLAKTQGANIGEKDVSSMVGCTIGDFVPIDVSGQSRDIDLPDGQVGWTRSLPEEGAHTNYEQPDRAESLVRNQIFTIQKVNRITGGGPTRRITPSRAVKDTTPRPDPTFPPLLNVLHLDILQLGNQKMVVADSNIPGAGKGLFTAKAVPAGTRLCTYEGDRLSKEDLPIPDIFPRFDYVWSNTTLTLIIDALNKTSFGPFMNDPLDEALCNAVIIQHNPVGICGLYERVIPT